MRIIFWFVFIYFCLFDVKCFAAQVAILYREDIPFYKEVVNKFEKSNAQICSLDRVDKCFNGDLKMVITLGDLAFKKALPYKNKYKIYAFFVTKCRSDSSVCCFYLFPTPKEVLLQIKRVYPKKKVVYLYTKETRWWIDNFSRAPKYLLELHDIKENLRKIFLKKFDVLVLAPDLLFMHPAFLKDLVVLSLSTSKILVGLSPIMLDYGIDMVVYYDYKCLFSRPHLSLGDIKSLKKLKIPIKVKLYGYQNS